jgi:hypothetical protein
LHYGANFNFDFVAYHRGERIHVKGPAFDARRCEEFIRARTPFERSAIWSVTGCVTPLIVLSPEISASPPPDGSKDQL